MECHKIYVVDLFLLPIMGYVDFGVSNLLDLLL